MCPDRKGMILGTRLSIGMCIYPQMSTSLNLLGASAVCGGSKSQQLGKSIIDRSAMGMSLRNWTRPRSIGCNCNSMRINASSSFHSTVIQLSSSCHPAVIRLSFSNSHHRHVSICEQARGTTNSLWQGLGFRLQDKPSRLLYIIQQQLSFSHPYISSLDTNFPYQTCVSHGHNLDIYIYSIFRVRGCLPRI